MRPLRGARRGIGATFLIPLKREKSRDPRGETTEAACRQEYQGGKRWRPGRHPCIPPHEAPPAQSNSERTSLPGMLEGVPMSRRISAQQIRICFQFPRISPARAGACRVPGVTPRAKRAATRAFVGPHTHDPARKRRARYTTQAIGGTWTFHK